MIYNNFSAGGCPYRQCKSSISVTRRVVFRSRYSIKTGHFVGPKNTRPVSVNFAPSGVMLGM